MSLKAFSRFTYFLLDPFTKTRWARCSLARMHCSIEEALSQYYSFRMRFLTQSNKNMKVTDKTESAWIVPYRCSTTTSSLARMHCSIEEASSQYCSFRMLFPTRSSNKNMKVTDWQCMDNFKVTDGQCMDGTISMQQYNKLVGSIAL